MCQEIYVNDAEAERHGNECWCPLAECYDEATRAQALRELGLAVYNAYAKLADKTPDSGEVEVKVVVKRW